MDYEKFTVENFLQDAYFIKWVKRPTPETDYFWETWLQSHPEKANEIALAKEIALSVQYKHQAHSSQADLIEVLDKVFRGKYSNRPEVGHKTMLSFPPIWRYAAVILLFSAFGAGLWIIKNHLKYQEENPVERYMVHKTTRKGQKLSVNLPDGSLVKLNSETKISYRSDFGENCRKLQLEGEAFFDVAHDQAKPFIIQTESLETTVLGTSFNINAYPGNTRIKVAVLSGKVKVSGQSEKLKDEESILLPKEMFSYEKESGEAKKAEIEIEDIFSWKDDILLFKNADYPELKATLERWYSVDFIEETQLLIQEDFSGKFEKTSLEKVLEALNYTSHFQYQLNNNKVYVTNLNNEN